MSVADSALEVDRIESYLSERLDVSVVDVAVLHDGLNLSLAISTADAVDEYVLRMRRKLQEADYITDLEDEFGVLERLRRTGVRAPEPVMFCEDESVLGGEFFVMTRLDGAVVPLGSGLPERFQTPDSRRRVAEALVDTLADIHSLDAGPFEAVCEHVTPRGQIARCVERLDAASAVTGRDFSGLREVATWLEVNTPPESRTTLVHGDYRPGNVLFADGQEPKLIGVLDWETALLGDPLTELGYLLLRWRDEGDPTPDLHPIESRYPESDAIDDLETDNERGLAPFTAEPGSPTRREIVQRYESQTGFTFEHERFYRALAAFMLATVWVDLHRQQIATGADSDWPPHIDYMTMIADSIASGEFRL